MIAIFVWTFDGVMQAIALGVVLLVFAIAGLLTAWAKLLEWLKSKRKPEVKQ